METEAKAKAGEKGDGAPGDPVPEDASSGVLVSFCTGACV